MSSVPGALGRSLHSNPFLSKNDAMLLQSEMMDLNVVIEDDALRRLLVWDNHIRERVAEHRIEDSTGGSGNEGGGNEGGGNEGGGNEGGGGAGRDYDRNRNAWHLTRQTPDPGSVRLYPLDSSITGTLTPLMKSADIQAPFGGGVKTDGSSRITISDNARLRPTTKITVAFWGYFSAFDGKYPSIIDKHNPTKNEGWLVYKSGASNQIIMTLFDGRDVNGMLNIPYTPDTWTHFCLDFVKNGTSIGYRNGSAVDSDTTFDNNIGYGTPRDLTIFGDPEGTYYLPNGDALQMLTVLNEDIQTRPGWLNDLYAHNHLDTKTADEILTYHFMGNAEPTPDAQLGGFGV